MLMQLKPRQVLVGQYDTYEDHVRADDPKKQASSVPTFAAAELEIHAPFVEGKRAIISSGKAFEARRANATMTFADGTEILFHIQGDGQPAHVAIPAEGADFGNIAAP